MYYEKLFGNYSMTKKAGWADTMLKAMDSHPYAVMTAPGAVAGAAAGAIGGADGNKLLDSGVGAAAGTLGGVGGFYGTYNMAVKSMMNEASSANRAIEKLMEAGDFEGATKLGEKVRNKWLALLATVPALTGAATGLGAAKLTDNITGKPKPSMAEKGKDFWNALLSKVNMGG